MRPSPVLKTVTHENLKDGKGRSIPTVMCEWISDQAKDDLAAKKVADEDTVLAIIDADPKVTQAKIATKMGWTLHNGEPNKVRAGRCIAALEKDKLVKKSRAGRYKLTPEGKKALTNGANE